MFFCCVMVEVCMKFVSKSFALLCIGLLGSCWCHAESDGAGWGSDAFALKGFGTLGFARSNDDSAEYVRDLSQPHGLTRKWSSKVDSLLGLQANLKLGTQTEGVLQVISRYRYDGSHDPEVSWAFLRHDFTPAFQARVGRLGTEFYMQADSRLVGYSNTTVRPPPDFYGPLVFSYFDGLDVSASAPLGDGLLRGKLFAGYSPERSPFVDPITWNLKGSLLAGGHLDYFVGAWQFRAAHAQVRFEHELPLNYLAGFDIISLVPELSAKDKTARFDSLGVIYDQGPLQIQAMLGRVGYNSASYEDSKAAFVIASYRVEQFTPYVGYSVTKSSASSIKTTLPWPGGAAIIAGAQTLTAATHSDQHTVTLGTRWDFYRNLALKAQLDMVRGQRESVFPFRGDDLSRWDGRMNVFSVALDFAF
jgi:hypothetical protein